MTANKILCATDFSLPAMEAVHVAARLAVDFDADLEIVHSWHVPAAAFSELTYPTELIQILRDESKAGLEEAVRHARDAGANRVYSKLVSGVPWLAITHEAEAPEYRLVVIGTHGRTGMSRVLLGSVAEKVVRHAPCSVLVVRPGGGNLPFTHALAPVDFTQASHDAMMTAAELVRPRGRVTLQHSVELPMVWAREAPPLMYVTDLEKRSRDHLHQWAEELKRAVDIPAAEVIHIERPGTDILATLDADPTIDIVVMGSHGRTGIKRALMGSVAEKIVRHSRCHVLVARKRH